MVAAAIDPVVDPRHARMAAKHVAAEAKDRRG